MPSLYETIVYITTTAGFTFSVNIKIRNLVPAITYFPMGASPVVSSALPRFTSLFGMGRGGTTASNHRNKIPNT